MNQDHRNPATKVDQIDPADSREDAVIRRMLKTPPKPKEKKKTKSRVTGKPRR